MEWGQISYFNNSPICEMIEGKYNGIIDLLNEETNMPGDPTDSTLLAKFNTTLVKNDFYDSYVKNKTITFESTVFKVKHYAGGVSYDVGGFLFKNRDELYKDLLYCMNNSKNKLIRKLFPENILTEASMKRPDTLGTQLRVF